MAFDLKKKGERLAELAVPFGDETINLKYRADKLTPRYLDEQFSHPQFCEQVIAEWDIVSDGEPYPITVESVSDMGVEIVYTLIYAIVDHVKTSAIQKLNR